MGEISIKRVYEYKKADESYRILIDRLWPRGIKKTDLHIDEWDKEISPSAELRKWFDHKEERFDEFTDLYQQELQTKESELSRLIAIAKREDVTLLYGAKDPKINHAVVLRDVLRKRL